MSEIKNNTDIIYDTECYPNFWCIVVIFVESQYHYVYEISERRNDIVALFDFFMWVKSNNYRMVGFNNLGYDYPMIHYLMNNDEFKFHDSKHVNKKMFDRNEHLINTPWVDRFRNMIPPYNYFIKQLDLFKIHHFDNSAKSTGLKVLEINMRSADIRDLPFIPGTQLTNDQMQTVYEYCIHDTMETEKFYHKSLKMIEFRTELSQRYYLDLTNHNDKKLGVDYLIKQLEEKLGPEICYSKRPRKPKQTIRDNIFLNDVIFSYIYFNNPEFDRILKMMKNTTISETKGVFKNVSCIVDRLEYKFGTGGIHGSVKSTHVKSCSEYAVVYFDVVSYYPSMAIANRLFPEHLTELFCDVYKDLLAQRLTFEKGTVENKMLKLALNGAFGDSNNKYSPFYDSAFTMAITLNGQFLLCMLADWFLEIKSLSVVHINTDGIIVRVNRKYLESLKKVKSAWEQFTTLNLDRQEFSDIWIRDVNSYISMDYMGDLTRIGAYEYIREWHQNHSMLVVRKAAEAYLTKGTNIRTFIRSHKDDFDFCLTAKVPRNFKLMWGFLQIQNTTRYYISKKGRQLCKLRKTNDVKEHTQDLIERAIDINSGWNAMIYNSGDMDRANVDYSFYIEETEKLIEMESFKSYDN